ncbi:MAG: FAD-dependent oxidoreductase, partial [Acidimicrobiales bacterium]
MTRPRIAVIGGGLAGVSAALAAVDGGADVVVFERRSRLGGLTWSFRRNGLWFDNGQHVFMRCCTAYRGFLERIGATGQVSLQPRLEVPVLAPGGITASITRTDLPAPFHL